MSYCVMFFDGSEETQDVASWEDAMQAAQLYSMDGSHVAAVEIGELIPDGEHQMVPGKCIMYRFGKVVPPPSAKKPVSNTALATIEWSHPSKEVEDHVADLMGRVNEVGVRAELIAFAKEHFDGEGLRQILLFARDGVEVLSMEQTED